MSLLTISARLVRHDARLGLRDTGADRGAVWMFHAVEHVGGREEGGGEKRRGGGRQEEEGAQVMQSLERMAGGLTPDQGACRRGRVRRGVLETRLARVAAHLSALHTWLSTHTGTCSARRLAR